MIIRKYQDSDWPEFLRMNLLWFPMESADNISDDVRAVREREDAELFVSEQADGSLAGFVEVGSRPYADGCLTSPVGYIEAWFVDAPHRRQGCGRALLLAAEEWARARGYREMASDARLENHTSHVAHGRSGYAEVDRIVQFRKELTPP
jgi:aminoglycoside 6'-N-acetyltransferase I